MVLTFDNSEIASPDSAVIEGLAIAGSGLGAARCKFDRPRDSLDLGEGPHPSEFRSCAVYP